MNQLPCFSPLSEPTRVIDDRRWMVAATLSASSNLFADAGVFHPPTVPITPPAATNWWSDLIDHSYDALVKFAQIKRAAEWIRDAVDWGGLVDWIGNLLCFVRLRTRK
jgi:hypothetical protein